MFKNQWIGLTAITLALLIPAAYGLQAVNDTAKPIPVETPTAEPTTVIHEDEFDHLQHIIDQGGDEAFYEPVGEFDYWEFEQLAETYKRRIVEVHGAKIAVANASDVDKKKHEKALKLFSDTCWEVASEYNMRARYLGDAELDKKGYQYTLNTNLCE